MARRKSKRKAVVAAKWDKTMGEFKRGELHSGSKSGPVVKSRKQAQAIAESQARKVGRPRRGKRK